MPPACNYKLRAGGDREPTPYSFDRISSAPRRGAAPLNNLTGQQNASALLSRREWLGKLALPATGAVIAAGILDAKPAEGARAKPTPSNDDLGARVYNIRSYGAKGDKTTVDTAALQAAIDACTADGGGTVLVPAGTFTIGTVELKSNVTLHISRAARCWAAATASSITPSTRSRCTATPRSTMETGRCSLP